LTSYSIDTTDIGLLPGGSKKNGGGLAASLVGFATGGVVPGSPGQQVPAMLHGGEQVLNRNQQAAHAMQSGSTAPFIGHLEVTGQRDPDATAVAIVRRQRQAQFFGRHR
jgi:hypothetical protein